MVYLERRRYVRIPFGLYLSDKTNNRIIGFSKNISIGGCFIEGNNLPSMGAKLAAGIELPDSLNWINFLAEVKWINPIGAGMEFFYCKEKERDMFKSFLEGFSK